MARRGVAVSQVTSLNRIVQDYLDSPEVSNLKSIHPRVSIQSELPPMVFNIVGSPVHLEKSIMNLVTNAAEAMPVISVDTKSRELIGPFRRGVFCIRYNDDFASRFAIAIDKSGMC